ncbi:toll/interleukin-1 receptor domain-containing protein [Flavisolibacter sp. BT320]|nr:toll/interleukin-1 receptor domain-containing protein [Flavisolibacter longurius]
MTSEMILQVQDPGTNSFTCEAFTGLPCPQPVYIAISFTDSPASERQAMDLKNALVTGLGQFGTAIQPSPPLCGGSAVAFGSCQALRKSGVTSVLFVVTDGAVSNLANPAILGWTGHTIVVQPQGQFIQLPAPLNSPQAAFWTNDVGDVLPELWRLMGMDHRDSRIFISYKKTDTSPLAEQLYEGLSKKGFEVFLDRFSIGVGIHFQRRLYQELADKAMVLFLESPNFQQSDWVKLEIAFAKKNRLGFYALNRWGDPRIPSIDDSYRYFLHGHHFTAGGAELNDQTLNHVIAEIKTQHSKALFRKRLYLQSNLYYFLQRRGLPYHLGVDGLIETADARGQSTYKIWATPRPAELEDYHFTDMSTLAVEKKLVVGPRFMEANRATRNEWLAHKVGIPFFQEGALLPLARHIQNGY